MSAKNLRHAPAQAGIRLNHRSTSTNVPRTTATTSTICRHSSGSDVPARRERGVKVVDLGRHTFQGGEPSIEARDQAVGDLFDAAHQ